MHIPPFNRVEDRPGEDQESMLKVLEQSTDSGGRDLAEFIKNQLD